MHLKDAIPEKAAELIHQRSDQLRRMAKRNSPTSRLELHRQIFRDMEKWLDRVTTKTYLSKAAVAEMVTEAIEYRQRSGRWNMLEYVLMPNHIHLFLEILSGSLKEVMEDFKRWTGHRAAEILGYRGERFWQDEWFDHWSRSDLEDERIVTYIQRNPVEAKLVSDSRDWPWGSW